MSFLSSSQKALIDRLGSIRDDVEARMMFGTIGLFTDDRQFGILEDENLYLSVDDESRAEFAQAETSPYSAATVQEATYLAVPEDVLGDPDLLAAWVHRAIEAAE